MNALKGISLAIVGIVLLAVLSVGVWQLGWFVETKNTDRRTQINDHSQGASYWEGYVQTVTGPAKWAGKKVVLTGKPTGDFSKGK